MNDDRLFTIDTIHIPKRESVTSWATKNHYLKRTASYLKYDRYAYMVEPTDATGQIDSVWGVCICCPSQCSKTTAMMNFCGWMCKYDRANTLVILDTAQQAVNLSKNRLRPFLREICHIHNDQTAFDNLDKSNSAVNISLGTGANLILGSAKSASTLCSTPVKFLLLDETDRYPLDLQGEGDPISLALQRQMTYRGMALFTSTPTTQEDSRIWKQFQLGTMEVWSVRCPTCSQPFSLKWKDIDWSDPENPTCTCPSCGEVWTEADVILMEHLYVQTNDNPQRDKYGRILRSFSINGLLVPQYDWKSLREYERAAMTTSEAALQSFFNTRLGETYTPPNEVKIEAQDLFRDCSERYRDECIPDDIDFVCAGCDTHDSGLYVLLMGFSSDLSRAYGLTYHFLPGDPNEPQVWAEFDALVSRKFVRTDGVTLMPAFAFADAGGHRANAIFLQTLRTPRLKPCKGYASSGSSTLVDPLIRRLFNMKFTNGVKGVCEVVEVGTNSAKDTILQMMKFTIAGDKRLIFPRKKCFDINFFRGLTSEVRVGTKWIAPRSGHTLNEPLDCLVYALACATYYKERYYDTRKDKEAVYRDLPLERTMEEMKDVMKDEAVPAKHTKAAKKKSTAAKKTKKKEAEVPVPDAPKVEKAVDSQKAGKAPKAPEADVDAPKKKFKHL